MLRSVSSVNRPGRTKGTHDRFWTRFVKTGSFPRTVFQVYFNAQDLRQQFDYEAFLQTL